MLEKPDIEENRIAECLLAEYGISASRLLFLPLGSDINTAVYRVFVDNKTSFFLKLRKGQFNPTSVSLPRFLSGLGIPQIIPALETTSGRLWGKLDAYKTVLYPYIEGRDGYEVQLSDRHWRELGTALNRIHNAVLPPALLSGLRSEDFSPHFRQGVKSFLSSLDKVISDDPITIELAAFLREKQAEILDLVERAEQLAQIVQKQPLAFTVCHADLHAGNIFIAAGGSFYLVDWDEALLAPKERDLMFIGGGLLASGLTAQQEEALFYQAYGQTNVNRPALAYYRFERIIQDIAAFCAQLLLTDAGGADRQQALIYLKSNFLPGNTIEIARQSDRSW